MPPKISPLAFPSQVSKGQRISVVCAVEQGDIEETNLTVTWLKDSKPLISTSRVPNPMSDRETITNPLVKILHVDAFSAMLIIDRADSSHTGNYSCIISNSVETVSSTVPLVVRGSYTNVLLL